jgi:uncharacterized protein GlcG (DUF336 family)
VIGSIGITTDAWHDFVKDDPPLAMGAAPGIDRLIVSGVGYPAKLGGAVIGEIGVTGGHYSQDMQVALGLGCRFRTPPDRQTRHR